MKRKTSEVPVRVYRYGCRVSEEVARQLRDEHLRPANSYYNDLIRLERERREQFRAVRQQWADTAQVDAKIAELEARLETARDGLNAKRQKMRRRVTDVELTGQIELSRTALREARAERKQILEAVHTNPKLKEAAKRIDDACYVAGKVAYATAPCFWGTKLMVQQAADLARKSVVDPELKRFTGSGRVGVQIQQILTTQGVFQGGSQYVQIDPLPPETWDTRSGRRHAYTKARIRVGSEGIRPVWLEVDLLMHRPLPTVGAIKWAWIQVSVIGNRTLYSLQIAVESELFVPNPVDQTAALHLSWSKISEGPDAGGMQVGYLLGEDGHQEKFVVSPKIMNQIQFAEGLRSAGDKCFDLARDTLRTWLDVHPGPSWMAEATEFIDRWRNHRKLARIAHQWIREIGPSDEELDGLFALWRHERFNSHAGKLDLFDTFEVVSNWLIDHDIDEPDHRMAIWLEWWRRKDAHLYSWECDQRRKGLAHRFNTFRVWAAKIRERYGKVVMEDWNLAQMAKNAKPEQEADMEHTHSQRVLAAPGEFRSALAGVVKIKVETAKCGNCGKPSCGCEVPADMARCWSLLTHANVDTTGVIGSRSSLAHLALRLQLDVRSRLELREISSTDVETTCCGQLMQFRINEPYQLDRYRA